MVESSPTCCICTESIKYYAIPEVCNHNMICWTCILKQRLKLDDLKCPMCKETSTRVLITDDPTDNLQKPWGSKIEDTEKQLVFGRQDIWTDVRRKIGFYCQMCTDKAKGTPSRQFPSVPPLREHYVKFHKVDFCELCIESKPVLLFEQ